MSYPLPTAELAPDMEMTNPPKPISVTVLVDDKPIAVVSLEHFFAVAKRINRAQKYHSGERARRR